MPISSQTMLCGDKLVVKANYDVNYGSTVFWRRFHNILKFLVCFQNYIFSVSLRCLSPRLWLPSSLYPSFLQPRHSWVTFSCLLPLGFTVHPLIWLLHHPLPLVHSILKLWLWFLVVDECGCWLTVILKAMGRSEGMGWWQWALTALCPITNCPLPLPRLLSPEQWHSHYSVHESGTQTFQWHCGIYPLCPAHGSCTVTVLWK